MKAKAVNDEIFEMHKTKERKQIELKKFIMTMKTNKFSNKSRLGRKGKAMYYLAIGNRHIFCSMGDNRDVDNVAKLKINRVMSKELKRQNN